MLNERSDVDVNAPLVEEALAVNENVVSVPTELAVPEMTPVEEFKDIPVGNEPDATEYVIACPSGSEAEIVNVLPDNADAKIVPRLPAVVLQTGSLSI